MTINATPTPGSLLVSPGDHTLIMIDFQSQMSFATKSIDAANLRTTRRSSRVRPPVLASRPF